MERKYTLNEIVKKAMQRYSIKLSSEDMENSSYTTDKSIRGDIRKKIENYVKSQKKDGKTLWELAEDRNYEYGDIKANKKVFHFFDKETVDAILDSDEIYAYCVEHSSEEHLSTVELNKIVADTHAEWERYLEKNPWDSPDYPGFQVESRDIEIKQIEIMLNALFELFFEPLKKELLADDMTSAMRYGGNTETLRSAEKRIRLQDDKNYYKPKFQEDILDVLADKVAERLRKDSKNNSKNNSHQ